MIDPKLLRENPEMVKANYKMRKDKSLIERVDKYLKYDEDWRNLMKEVDELRQKRNISSKQISKLKGEEKQAAIAEMKEVNKQLAIKEKLYKEAEEQRQDVLDRLPNLLHESVPFGEDEEDNVVIRTYGEKPTFDFEPKSHHELMENLDLVEIDRARTLSGSRFYFLKGKAVILELSLIQYALDVVQGEGFEIFSAPSLVRKEALYGTGYLPIGEEDIYKIEGEDLALVGTSEVALGGMYKDHVFVKDEFPVQLAAISSCYRTEASASTKDDKGIFRVHEFKKVEMFKFADPEKSWDEQEHLISVAEKVFSGLGIPYHVVNICTGDIGVVAARKYDIEAFMPGQNRYREVVSCSNCTEYQSRRLKIRYREKEGGQIEGYVHTLNSTVLATTRAIVAILENYQQADGSVIIPEVLQKYTGFAKIEPPH